MNELKQRRLQKQYESYYTTYNNGIRQIQEKQEAIVVKGTVTWNESNDTTTKLQIVGGN